MLCRPSFIRFRRAVVCVISSDILTILLTSLEPRNAVPSFLSEAVRFSAGGCAEVMLLRSSSTSLTVRVSSSRTPVSSLLNCAYRPVGAACSVRLCMRSNRSLTALRLDAIRLSTLLMPSRSWTVLDSAIELTSLVSSYSAPFPLPLRAQCTKR